MNEVILSNKQINTLYQLLNNSPTWSRTIKTSKKENDNVEEKLNKFLDENNIPVNDNNEFTMYVVVDANDKDHEVGAIIYKEDTEVYAESRAYEDLKGSKSYGIGGLADCFTFKLPKITNSLSQTKRNTIREDLLSMEDKMFAVTVNKKDVSDVVADDIVYINKYKVIAAVSLNPILKYKVTSIDDAKIAVKLYNNLTEKSEMIVLRNVYPDSLDDIGEAIRDYLTTNERQVELINSTVDDGVEL